MWSRGKCVLQCSWLWLGRTDVLTLGSVWWHPVSTLLNPDHFFIMRSHLVLLIFLFLFYTFLFPSHHLSFHLSSSLPFLVFPLLSSPLFPELSFFVFFFLLFQSTYDVFETQTLTTLSLVANIILKQGCPLLLSEKVEEPWNFQAGQCHRAQWCLALL